MEIKNLFFDIPGRAMNKPIVIDNNAAKIDNCIVELNPPIKNCIFVHPDFVVGSITYHPQIPDSEHPERKQRGIIKIYFLTYLVEQ